MLRSPLPTIAAVNGAGGRRGDEPRARVRRAPRRRVRPLRHPVPEDRPPPRRRARLDARTRGRARRPRPRWCCSASPVDGARAAEIGLAWSCHPDDELLDAAAHARGPRRRARRSRLLGRVKATLRQAPWQPDFEAAIATEVDPPGLVARPGLVPDPEGLTSTQRLTNLATSSCPRSRHSSTRDRVADVILVHALDLQEPQRGALVAQPELLGDPPARRVARHDRRFEPVQPQHLERVAMISTTPSGT